MSRSLPLGLALFVGLACAGFELDGSAAVVYTDGAASLALYQMEEASGIAELPLTYTPARAP